MLRGELANLSACLRRLGAPRRRLGRHGLQPRLEHRLRRLERRLLESGGLLALTRALKLGDKLGLRQGIALLERGELIPQSRRLRVCRRHRNPTFPAVHDHHRRRAFAAKAAAAAAARG